MSTKGNIAISGVQAFADLFTAGGAPGYDPKFSQTIQVAKGSPSEAALFAAVQDICQSTWPDSWEAKLTAIHGDIMNGVPPADSKISLQDGDQYQSSYNAGFWVVKPSRRTNQGPPGVFSIPGERVHNEADPGCPKDGWGVASLINVWAMKTKGRVNFTLISTRASEEGVKIGGPPPAAIEAANEEFLAMPLPAAIPGVISPQSQLAPGASQAPAGAVPAAAPVAAVPQAAPASPAPSSAVPGGPPAGDLGLEDPDEQGGLIEL